MWVCVHACTELCIYEGVSVCFFALMCAVFTVFCCIPWCDCSMHVCACVGTSYQHHECRYCSIFFFFFSLQRSLIIFPLRCRVIGYLKKTTGLQWLSFWVHRQSTRRLLICWYWTVLIIMNLITVWNKTSLDYLNNLGREEESNCWYWSVGVCLKKKKKKGFGELSCQRNLGLKTCNFSVNTVFCIECLLFC